MAALGAVITLPFTLIRLALSRRQTQTAEDQLYNDKLNSATTDLAARHQVTREIGRGTEKRILTEWQDDLLTRAAAIDRLEGLAHEREDEAPRIARTLSLYVRELTRTHAPETPPENASASELRDWVRGLQPVRPDMESAAQSLGHLQPPDPREEEPIQIDLRRANLEGFNLSQLRLRGAQLDGAVLHGAYLVGAKMQGANLNGAELQGAELVGVQLQDANLGGAKLQGVNLSGAQLQGADLNMARVQGAHLGGAELQGTVLVGARLQGADLFGAQLQGAILEDAELQGAELQGAELVGGFYRCTTNRGSFTGLIRRWLGHSAGRAWAGSCRLARPLAKS